MVTNSMQGGDTIQQLEYRHNGKRQGVNFAKKARCINTILVWIAVKTPSRK